VTINLDLPPTQRYTAIAVQKKDLIIGFMDYLRFNQWKYYLSFQVIAFIETWISQDWLRSQVG
jgi:hypothetical protein